MISSIFLEAGKNKWQHLKGVICRSVMVDFSCIMITVWEMIHMRKEPCDRRLGYRTAPFVGFHMLELWSCDMMSEDAAVTDRRSTKQVIIGHLVPCHLFRTLASCPVNHSSEIGYLVSACPTYICQSVLPSSVFGNSHVPWHYLYVYSHNKLRPCSVTDPCAFERKHPRVSDWIYEPYQQCWMNSLHPWIRTENITVSLCFSEIHTQI